jgi:alpha-tubulin suppressor-like RCC1 family protein
MRERRASAAAATSLALGSNFSCAIEADGKLFCWGANNRSQLTRGLIVGGGVVLEQQTPAQIPNLNPVTAISTGDYHTCAIFGGENVLRCWGASIFGQTGFDAPLGPAPYGRVNGVEQISSIREISSTRHFAHLVPLAGAPVDVAAGENHTCVALSNGLVQCFGRNHYGEVGDNTDGLSPFSPLNPSSHRTRPVTVTAVSGAAQVSAGDHFSCARLSSGGVKCWGNGFFGQLGNGAMNNSKTPVDVSGVSAATAIASGATHSCVIDGGAVKCWGLGQYGQIGGSDDSATAIAVAGISGATSIAAGEYHTCAVVSGTVKCWGRNQHGQLGNNSRTDSGAPVDAFGITNATAVFAGDAHTCAILAGGDVRCWGRNERSQLGNGTRDTALTPVTVTGYGAAAPTPSEPPPPAPTLPTVPVTGTLKIAAGQYHTCLLREGRTNCWGANGFGQLGDGTTITRHMPLTLTTAPDFVKIVAGGSTTCALNPSGQTYCWGLGAANRYATLDSTDRLVPTLLAAVEPAKDLGMGYLYHTCIQNVYGEVKCWGQAILGGEVGDGNGDIAIEPAYVTGVTNASSFSASGFHSCAVVQRDALKCWGDNQLGKVGDGSATVLSPTLVPAQRYTPVYVSGLKGVKNTELGQFHSCAVMIAGGVRCWGYNLFGQLGNGTKTFSQTTPVAVTGLENVVELTLGVNHSCALLADSTVKCWGRGIDGQLGNGAAGDSAVPVTVVGLTGVVGISAGDRHTCAVLNNGSAACWGSNEQGQLAVPPGQLPFSTVPIDPATGKPAQGVPPGIKPFPGSRILLPVTRKA